MLIRAAECSEEPTRHGNWKRVLLRDGMLPGVTQVAVAMLKPGEEVELHTHPTMYEVFYVLEGRAEYQVGEVRHEAGPGDLLIVPPATPHGLRVLEAPHRVFYWGLAT